MDQKVIKSYVCTRDERMFWRYWAPVGLGIVGIFAIILLIEVFRIRNSVGAWLFAFAWLVFFIYLIVRYSKVCVTPQLEFSLEEGQIKNIWPKGNKIELNLAKSYFCTKFICPFAFGTATIEKEYYLFSEKPLTLTRIKQNGFCTIEEINRNKVIIIPKTETTEIWVQQNVKVNQIPVYPAVAFKQGSKS